MTLQILEGQIADYRRELRRNIEVMGQAIDMLRDQWIPCKDRLPTAGLILTVTGDQVAILLFDGEDWSDDGGNLVTPPTHWKPIGPLP